jgi:hypothetical protein
VSSPIWGSWPNIYYCLTVSVLFLWGALSDERAGLSFVYAAGPCQSSLSRVRVPRDSWLILSNSLHCFLYRLGTDEPQKTHQLLSNGYHVLLSGVSTHALPSNWRPIVAHSLLWYVFTGLLPSNGRPSVFGCALVGTCSPVRLLEPAQSVTIFWGDCLHLWQRFYRSDHCKYVSYNSVRSPKHYLTIRTENLKRENLRFRYPQVQRQIWRLIKMLDLRVWLLPRNKIRNARKLPCNKLHEGRCCNTIDRWWNWRGSWVGQ